jgi:hypothetical protein
MKFSNGNIVLILIALLVATASAEDVIFIAVRTLLHVEEPLSAPEMNAIDNAMHDIEKEIDTVLEDVAAGMEVPPVRNLRVDNDRRLNCAPCNGFPSYYTGCWVNFIWRDRCKRALTMHEDLSEDAIADLNENNRRRHLQISTLCEEAKAGVASTIEDATREGVVPLPDGGKFVEQCFYEIA